ncbi:MAG: methyltransferase domain-containing protein [Actinomycetota bacterium]
MTHKFDPANINKLDNEWRRQNLPPLSILEKLGLSSTDIAADIGCGIGYFTIPAAGVVNNANNVFALDTSDQMLAEVKKRMSADDISNIVIIKTGEYDLKLPDESVTFALIVNVLHEIEDKVQFMAEIKRILKPEGKIAIIEWEKENMEMGPPIEHRIGKEETGALLKSLGIRINATIKLTDIFYGLTGIKT